MVGGSNLYCFKTKIQDSATYEFPEDTAVLDLVDQAFPECSADKCFEKRESCQDVGKIFDRLRKAAFLNPSHKEYWRYLSCIYASAGFADNAKGMRSIYNGLLGAKEDEGPEHFIDNSCEVNEDCIFVSKCIYDNNTKEYDYREKFFLPANKNYVTECQGIVPCGSSCRCDSSKREIRRTSFLGRRSYNIRLRCVNFQCVGERANSPFKPEQDFSKKGQR